MAQPFLLNLILKVLQARDSASVKSLPLHSLALAMPSSFYTFPSTVLTETTSFVGFHPTTPVFTAPLAADGDYRQMAYFYAMISFFCQVAKAQCNVQSRYYAMRASIRSKTEMIACVYEKSLVRKDISGTVASDAKKPKEGEKENAVASADIGKIVSLVATDSSSISFIVYILTVSLDIFSGRTRLMSVSRVDALRYPGLHHRLRVSAL